ncbi:Lrp/AsnC family transcriptional regulator [Cognatishimia sp.]|uniref:Lrp/AsnC family transcriptional regulator n=1 Tax=Cognatishimia sp. TaxID=2211648 RepID=UPI003514EB2F
MPKAKPAELSQNDRLILKAMQENCRLTTTQLAEEANMSASTCWRRIQAMEADKVISGYVAEIDAERVGLGFSAVAMVKMTRHSNDAVENFVQKVQKRPEIMQCFAITGEGDFMLRVVAEDMADYRNFLNTFLFKLEGVDNVNTAVVMETIKDGSKLPL